MAKDFLSSINDFKDYEFWQAFRDYCKNFEIPDKRKFVESLPLIWDRIKNDMASFSIYEALRKFAIKKPDESIEIIEMIEAKGTPETLEFSSSLLGGLSQSNTSFDYKEKILSLIDSLDIDERHTGIRAAYLVKITDEGEELKFVNKVHKSLISVIESRSERSLGIITRFYNRHLDKIKDSKITVIRLLESKNLDVQSEVARSLNEEFKVDDDVVFFTECLNLLAFTKPKHEGIYSTINHRLEGIVCSHPDIIIEFINNWVLNNKSSLNKVTILKEIIIDLYLRHPESVESMFLKWLNSDNRIFKKVLQFVISDLSYRFDYIGLDKKMLKELSETDSLYIVYMIVGYILDRKYATEMLYDILEVNSNNDRIKKHIASIFVHYLIINYYSVTDILKEKKKKANKEVNSVIDQIINNSNLYYEKLSQLELINEFEPSEKRMSYFLKQQNIQMQKLMDESEKKKGSLLDIFTSIGLRAGKSSFTKYNGGYTQESEMQKISSKVEVARVQYIDEIGQMKLRLMWQNMKRDELPD